MCVCVSCVMCTITDYGEEWLDTREGTFADGIPRYSDYITAASVIDKLKKNLGKQVLTGT
jgi:hypothetical protein